MVDIFQRGRIIGFAAGTKYHRADIKLKNFLLLAVVDGLGQAGIHALVALAAITTVQTTGGFLLPCGLIKAQLNFVEIALAFFNRQFRHFGPGHLGFIFGNRPIPGIVINNWFAPLGHVTALNITQDGFGGLFAGADCADGHPGAGLQVTAGKHTFAFSGEGYRIDFGGSPAREGQPGNIFDGG